MSEAERHWTGVEKWSVGTGGIGERREPHGMCAVSPPLCLMLVFKNALYFTKEGDGFEQ